MHIHTHLVRHGNRQEVSFHGFRHRHHPAFLLWFPSVVFIFDGFRRRRKRFSFVVFMVSVVGLFLWFPSWQENISYGFRRWIFGGFCGRRRIQHFIMYRAIPFCCCVFLGLVSVAVFVLMVSVVAGTYIFLFMVSVVARNFSYGFRRFHFYFVCLWFPAVNKSNLPP